MNSFILHIDNDGAFLSEVAKRLPLIGEQESGIESIKRIEEVEEILSNEEKLDALKLILLDLELGGVKEGGPYDKDGRDELLPLIRTKAPWIPVILLSIYPLSTPGTLEDVSPFGFDAISSKRFFKQMGNEEWQRLRDRSFLSRAANLTGRSISELNYLLTQELNIHCGQSLKPFVTDDFENILKLADFGGKEITLDEIKPGFSGMKPIKVTAYPNTKNVQWLAKFGVSIRKAYQEIRAHRRMFTDGLTRHLSVPPLWWTPIFFKSMAMIAYEFETETLTLLEAISNNDIEKTLDSIVPGLEVLYSGSSRTPLIPRDALKDIAKDLIQRQPEAQYPIVKTFIENKCHHLLDNSLYALSASMHGDLHTRNILLTKREPFFIDFAHYKSKDEQGVPLFDLAKLCTDIWVFAKTDIPLIDLLSGNIMTTTEFQSVSALCLQSSTPTEQERQLFQIFVRVFLSLYTSYKDVTDVKKREIINSSKNDTFI